jgi:hypothetical protein
VAESFNALLSRIMPKNVAYSTSRDFRNDVAILTWNEDDSWLDMYCARVGAVPPGRPQRKGERVAVSNYSRSLTQWQERGGVELEKRDPAGLNAIYEELRTPKSGRWKTLPRPAQGLQMEEALRTLRASFARVADGSAAHACAEFGANEEVDGAPKRRLRTPARTRILASGTRTPASCANIQAGSGPEPAESARTLHVRLPGPPRDSAQTGRGRRSVSSPALNRCREEDDDGAVVDIVFSGSRDPHPVPLMHVDSTGVALDDRIILMEQGRPCPTNPTGPFCHSNPPLAILARVTPFAHAILLARSDRSSPLIRELRRLLEGIGG